MLGIEGKKQQYFELDQLLEQIPEHYRVGFYSLLTTYAAEFAKARGSTTNHQAWIGGYLDHVREVMNVAIMLYKSMNNLRPLPFSLSDVQTVLFIHDLEKPWAYEEVDGIWRRRPGMKECAHEIRLARLLEVGISLPHDLERALFFVEGEGQDYNNGKRGMSPLAAFCHMCDVASARVWHDHPKSEGDYWKTTMRNPSIGASE